MSHTFSPEEVKRAQRIATTALLLAAVTTVLVFFPAEGEIMVPLHEALTVLLGRAAFVLPLALALVGVIALACRMRPGLALPRRRLVGLGMIALALLPSDRLLGGSTGALGDWLTRSLIDLVGAPVTVALVVALVAAGVVLTFDLSLRKPIVAAS